MSRSSHQRQQQKLQQQQQLLAQQQQMADNDAAAAAAELFDLFCVATTMRQVLGLHRNMCDLVGLRPAPLNEFYPKLKAKIRSWKAQALWKKFDARAAHRAYSKGTAATGTRVLVIGAGPCGLRTAIEAQLLGAKVVVVEKRDRISRNNVLHLWPFVITDLRNLGAKKFYGKFCAGSIDHISIRQIQCILLKVALLLGVEVHEGVSFDGTIEPNGDGCGWRAAVSPEDHAVSHYEFDVLIGADGKRNTLEGFKRKEFRGKLAIAITANFINKKTEAEAKAEEISGVAFIFNQSFFKELYHTTGIDLENIVYYKDETHYFVMTAKKHSLIDKGVIMQDFADPAELLAPANVNTEKLLDYAREAAEFSTKYQMPNLEFAVNHYGKPDVAMFDFTSMFAAETSCRAIVRKGFRLLQCLVGDSLLEPFWPTGSGCARGFLSSMDAAYAIKLWSNAHNSTLGVLAQRESIYRLLNQTTPENLQRDIGSYTVDPATRYPNLNRTSVNVWQVKHLIDTDDTAILEQTFMDTNVLQATQVDTPVRRKRRSGDSLPLSTVLLRWICAQLHSYEFTRSLKEVSDVFTHGKVLCALINRYRPDLVDFNAIKELSSVECNDIAFRVLEKELNIPRIITGKDAQQLNTVESKIWLNYLEQICEVFRGEIPHVKHPKMDFSELRDKHRYNANAQPDFSKLLQISTKHKAKSPMQDMVDTTPQAGVQRRSVLDEEKLKRQRKHAAEVTAAAAADQQGHADTPRRAKKRRSAEKAANIEERQKRLQEIEQNRQDRQSKRRQQRYQQTQNFYKSLHMLQANTLLRESDEASAFEDYSIFMYRQQAPVFNDRVKELERKLLFPDRERSDIPSALPRNATDEQFSDRIKSMEQRITSRNTYGTEKKPKDLMRAIGKIDSNDWNVREIEKKIEQSKKTEIHGPKGREKVPKWSKEQFMARQNKMSKPMRQDSGEEKFKEIDQTLKNLDKQLKEGSVLEIGERGRNKVASIAGQFVKKDDTSDEKNPPTVVQKSSSKVALAFKKQAASEKCHFCKQTVYLMEKITTEGLILHRSCLKCYHCHTNLRPGGYAFDRDDPNGHFYCTQHFRLPAKAIRPVVRKPGQRKPTQQQQAAAAAAATTVTKNDGDNVVGVDGEPKTPDKLRGHADSVAQLDLLDRGQTPERIEFENTDAMSDGEPSEEHIIDENEWSGRNFLPESNNDSESDLSSSEESDTESDSDIFEEANDSPLGVQTLQLATDWIGKQNYSDSDDSDDFYDSSDGIPDDGKDEDTEGEEFKKARELRREEVRLLPLPANLPTDTETEVQTDSESSSSNKVEQNSATEISTDSEFDHDEIIRETPKIFIDDTHLRKPTKVQVKSSIISPSMGQKFHTATTAAAAQTKGGSYLQKYQTNQQPIQPQFKPLVQVDPSVLCANRVPLQNPRPGDYLLNKTASTEGIASKKSLELKKRYLLGEQANGTKIQKSGSTSVLDSKIRSFHSNISECQKLLNPSNDISPSMKNFLDRTKIGVQHSASDASNILRHSATGNILNDLKVKITIQKASSTASTDNEKENLFVNSKNELNKGMEYSETVNTTLVESMSKKSPTTPTNTQTIIETIDLVTPEKKTPIIDLTQVEIPTKMLESNVEFINSIDVAVNKDIIAHTRSQLLHTDSNKILDATCESPVRSDTTVIEDVKPDVSKDVKECIPDIIEHIETCDVTKTDNKAPNICSAYGGDEEQLLLSNSYDEEKKDSPEKNVAHDYENDDLQIQVPNIPWSIRKPESCSSSASTNCSSNTSSIEDIQHYILESTTSPDTQTAPNGHQVPRLEVHDTAGELMQIDSLMIIDGRYIGDPEDLKLMDIPEGLIIPDMAPIKTSEVDDEPDIEPVTATPEPADHTVIEAENKEVPPLPENGPPLPERGPPKMKPVDLKFDTRNENKVESLKNLPLIVEQISETCHATKPLTLNLKLMQQSTNTPITLKANDAGTPLSPLVDNDKTPTAELYSRGSDSETEATGTGQVLTETELSDWTADDCISENFIDIEFVLNSSKGTIKRNKNGAKKKKTLSSYKQLPTADRGKISKVNDAQMAPVAEFEGILRNLDIDEIEFMDTGSEGSYAEAYSATNTAMLRNRGYMEYIETAPKSTMTTSRKINADARPHLSASTTASNSAKYKPVPTKRDEVLGIDYIEQGAYIMHRGESHNDLLKTPVNELPSQTATPTSTEKALRTQLPNALTQSLTDSSTLNDVDDDSLGLGTTNSATNTKTTTDESEALTVVTSPLDSSSPKMAEAFAVKGSFSTPSSSDKNPKTSTLSTCTPATSSNATSSRQDVLVPTSTGTNSVPPTTAPNSTQRQASDDLSYEDYVRALQQKITQISNARDSLDTRKQRRKSSKGEAPLTTFSIDAQTVIEKTRIAGGGGLQSEIQAQTSSSLALAPIQPVDAVIVAQPPDAALAQVHKVPEITTLTRRLEEITKERTKQKDLIHDLVMDKLQSKKQLNAEKRLHRSRQRTLLTSGGCGYTSGSSLSPTPKLAAAATTTDTNCTNQAHYHVSTSAVKPPTERPVINERSASSSFKENNPLQKSATFVAAYPTDTAVSPIKTALAYKQRPFSEHLNADQVNPLERYKLTKTPSFSYPMYTSRRNLNSQQPIKENKQKIANSIFNTPIAPIRNNRGSSSGAATLERPDVVGNDDELCVVVSAASTEKLRTEARARARLKSNNELGLSPEEKMQLLRKRLHLEDVIVATVTPNSTEMYNKSVNKVMGTREHKMSSSKSVNDLVTAASHYGSKLNNCAADENSNTTQSAVIADFTSDPNLLLSSTSQATAIKTLKSSKSNHRPKDPDRRKSIIQSLSSFFHMGSSSSGGGNAGNKKDSLNADATASAVNSAQPERPGTSGSSTTSSSVDGVFSRFRIAPKTKEKSKDKDGGHIDASIRSHAIKTTHFERSNSQDCILNTRTNNNSNTTHNNLNHHHKHLRSSSATSVTAKYSASSPQLYVDKNNAATHVDEQIPPPIPPLPLNYQRSDDESYATETREQKKQRSISKAVRQAELKRLRIAQEIQREQEEIEVQLKELEARGVMIEKALRGEGQHVDSLESSNMMGASDEKLLKELLEIWRNITQLKKRDDELGIRQQELQLEHRHAQLKEELNIRLSSSKLDKGSADVAAEGAILNEMLEIVAKRAALRPSTTASSAADKETKSSQAAAPNTNIELVPKAATARTDTIKLNTLGGQALENNESQI